MPAKPLRIAALAVAATVMIAGCGSGEEGTIPQADADTLLSYVQAVDQNIADNECALAVQQAENFSEGVKDLPPEVDGEVRQGLEEAAVQLLELTSDPSQCDDTGASGASGAVEEASTAVETTTEEVAPPAEETTAEPTTTPEAEQEPAPQTPAQNEPELSPPTGPPSGNNGNGNPNPGGGVGPTGGIGERQQR